MPGPMGARGQDGLSLPLPVGHHLEGEGAPGHMPTGDPRMRPPWTSKGVATKDTKPTPLQ